METKVTRSTLSLAETFTYVVRLDPEEPVEYNPGYWQKPIEVSHVRVETNRVGETIAQRITVTGRQRLAGGNLSTRIRDDQLWRVPEEMGWLAEIVAAAQAAYEAARSVNQGDEPRRQVIDSRGAKLHRQAIMDWSVANGLDPAKVRLPVVIDRDTQEIHYIHAEQGDFEGASTVAPLTVDLPLPLRYCVLT